MEQEFDAFEYVESLRRRWRVIAGSCAVAVLLTGAVSFLLPKRYTAVASILIDPPAGNDSRTATAVSPVYLESLKTYEHFASSDTLFKKALDKFHFADTAGGASLEGLKRRILKVNKVRDTKILEINVTLSDPQGAQALVQYLAEETVNLSQALLRDGETDLLRDAQQQRDATQTSFNTADAAWREFTAGAPIEGLKGELESLADLKSRIRRDYIDAAAEAADAQEQAKGPADSARPKQDAEGVAARSASLEKQSRHLEDEWKAKNTLLAQLESRRVQLAAQREAAKNALDAALVRYREVRNSVGYRGERLKVIDPGIVPQRPSSPNVPLNVIAALLAALVASVSYVSLDFVWRRRRTAPIHERRPVPSER